MQWSLQLACRQSTVMLHPQLCLLRPLRAIERKRASRTHDMVKLARYNVNLICRKRTWLVRLDTHAVFPEGCLGH